MVDIQSGYVWLFYGQSMVDILVPHPIDRMDGYLDTSAAPRLACAAMFPKSQGVAQNHPFEITFIILIFKNTYKTM